MRMRSLGVLGLVSVCAVVPLACTSILGDYAIGAGPTNDGGMDGLVTSETSLADGPETSADASAYLKLTCAEKTTSRLLLGNFATMNGPARIWAMRRPTGVIRAVVPDNGGGRTHVFTFSTDTGSSSVVTDSPLLEQVLSVKAYVDGIAALIERNVDGGQGRVLYVVKLLDGSQTWSAGVPVTAPTDLDCETRLSATFEIVDEPTDNYFVAFTYTPSSGSGCPPNGPPRIFGRHHKGTNGVTNPWALPPVGSVSGNSGLEFLHDSIVVDGADVYVIANPNGASGPPAAGSAPAIYKTNYDMNAVPSGTFLLKGSSDFMLGTAVSAGLKAGTMNLGFFQADLGSATAKPEMYAGQMPAASVVGSTPSAALATTVLPGLPDLIVDKARFHWESFTSPAQSENLIGIGPPLSDLADHTGANFIWWDGEGRVRGQRTGTMTNLLTGELVIGVDAVFTSAPRIQLANLRVVFMKTSADASQSVDVWATDVACSP